MIENKGVAAVYALDRVLFKIVKSRKNTEVCCLAQLFSYTSDERGPVNRSIASLAGSKVSVDVGAVVFVLQDNINDACNCVRSISCAGAIFQDLYTVHRRQRNRIEIDEALSSVLREWVRNLAQTVDQHKGRIDT